jgi:hypothetical protein
MRKYGYVLGLVCLLSAAVWVLAGIGCVTVLSGCGSAPAWAAAWAAGGAATAEVRHALIEREEQLVIRHEQELDQWAAALDTTEKARLAAQAAATLEEKQAVSATIVALDTGRAAATTDWKSPTASATTAALITNILTALYYRRKDKKL